MQSPECSLTDLSFFKHVGEAPIMYLYTNIFGRDFLQTSKIKFLALLKLRCLLRGWVYFVSCIPATTSITNVKRVFLPFDYFQFIYTGLSSVKS